MNKIMLYIDRALSGKSHRQLLYLFSLIAIVILIVFLIVLFYCRYNENGETAYNIFLEVIAVFIDPGSVWNVNNFNQAPSESIPSLPLLLIPIFGLILFIGVFISVLSNVFERRVESFRNGEIAYELKNHVVIIGYNDMVPMFIKQICNDRNYAKCQILVQSSLSILDIRNCIYAEIADNEHDRVLFLSASRGSVEDMQNLYSYQAREIFIIGDKLEQNHDSINIACLTKLVNIHRNRKNCKKIPFNVLFESNSTYKAFQLTDISEDWREYIEFHPINIYREWAKTIFVSRQYNCGDTKIKYPDVLISNNSTSENNDCGSRKSNKYLHIVIVGMNKMGTSIGVEAAQLFHFPNSIDENGNLLKHRQTVITFIDDDAKHEMDYFCNSYMNLFDIAPAKRYECNNHDEIKTSYYPHDVDPLLFDGEHDFLDVRYEFVNGRIESQNVQRLIAQWADDDEQTLSIIVCFSNPAKSIATSLNLHDNVYRNNINVFVRQENSNALLSLIGSKDVPNKYHHLYPFGMLDNAISLGDAQRIQAQRVNYLYDFYNNHNEMPTHMPDESTLKKIWNEKSVSHQWSNIYVALSLQFKTRYIQDINNLTDKEVEMLAMVEHNRWNVERLLLGYRKPTKEEMKAIQDGGKEVARYYKNMLFAHPDIKPYNKLSENSKQYDRNIAKGASLIITNIKI